MKNLIKKLRKKKFTPKLIAIELKENQLLNEIWPILNQTIPLSVDILAV